MLHDVVFTLLAITAGLLGANGLVSKVLEWRHARAMKRADATAKKAEAKNAVTMAEHGLAERLLTRIERLERDLETARQDNRRLKGRVLTVEEREDRTRHRLREKVDGWEDTGKHSVPSMPAVRPGEYSNVPRHPTPERIGGRSTPKKTPR